MNYLKDITEHIESVCRAVPNVNTVYTGNIWDLSTKGDTEYSAMVLDCTGADYYIEAGMTSFDFGLFYADIQTDDGNNVLDIQSHAVEVLCNVADKIAQQYENIEIEGIQLFEERLSSLCAGAMITFTVTVFHNPDCKWF